MLANLFEFVTRQRGYRHFEFITQMKINRCKIRPFYLFQLGNLTYFSLEYWTTVLNFRHTCGIKSIFCDTDGTKLLFIDDHNQGYVYCPVRAISLHSIPL